jgi:SAM-dependent methyltransferase
LALLRHSPREERVLDVGCGSGLLGMRLRERHNTVWGIDASEDIAELASRRLDRFMLGDVTARDSVSRMLGDARFDTIVFADILEHLPDPVGTLASYRRYLAPNGQILISVPNVAVWYARLGLLFGRFEYTATGTLDRTHLRFFTRSSLLRALRTVDLSVETLDINPGIARAFVGRAKTRSMRYAQDDRGALLNSRLYRLYVRAVYPLEYRLARLLPGLLAFQYVIVGRAAGPGG